jgi:hypothetical protein
MNCKKPKSPAEPKIPVTSAIAISMYPLKCNQSRCIQRTAIHLIIAYFRHLWYNVGNPFFRENICYQKRPSVRGLFGCASYFLLFFRFLPPQGIKAPFVYYSCLV